MPVPTAITARRGRGTMPHNRAGDCDARLHHSGETSIVDTTAKRQIREPQDCGWAIMRMRMIVLMRVTTTMLMIMTIRNDDNEDDDDDDHHHHDADDHDDGGEDDDDDNGSWVMVMAVR